MNRQAKSTPLTEDELGLIESERLRQEIREWNKTRSSWPLTMREQVQGGYFPEHDTREPTSRII